MRVLGIETSCDETGVAIYDSEQQRIVEQALYSQVDMHATYGGVVPELASRDHVRKLLPLIEKVTQASASERSGEPPVDAIAYTAGPGLMGALLVGAAVGRSLAYAWGVPSIEVHHMEGHLLAPMLEDEPPTFPFVALLVSGGHTQLVAVRSMGDYEILGETLDDAAGEAFDKAAKMLGLPYPGGPAIAKAAIDGNPHRFKFPRPMVNRPGVDFSFSGLKTFCLNTVHALRDAAVGDEGVESDQRLSQQDVADVACAFQSAVVDTLVIKCKRALQQTGYPCLVVAGGVGANRELRAQLSAMVTGLGAKVAYPRPDLCTDNGAMIAYAGWCRLAEQRVDGDIDLGIRAQARWNMESLTAISLS